MKMTTLLNNSIDFVSFPARYSFFFLLLVLGNASCTHHYYAPNDGYLMGLSEKGDVKLSGGFGAANSTLNEDGRTRRNYNLQVGCSPVKHLGIQASYFYLNDKTEFINDGEASGFGEAAEIAAGYYTVFNSDSPGFDRGEYWLWDAYVGLGNGSVTNNYNTGGSSILDFRKYFIHSSIHFQLQKSFSVGFGLRTVFVDYRRADIFGRVSTTESDAIKLLQRVEPLRFLEPSLRIQGGSRYFKFFFSTSFTSSVATAFSSNLNSRYIRSIANLGLIIEPDEFFRNKGKEKKKKRNRR